jgi:pimeloyl-ACP methyl ester carboxylesterase
LYVAPDGRFDAVVALAPGAPTLLKTRAANTRVPLLVIASEQDQVVPIAQVDEYWEAVGDTTKLYVVFPGGTHLNYVDGCLFCGELDEERGHELIRRYVTAWLYTHQLGDPRYESYLAADPPDAVVR